MCSFQTYINVNKPHIHYLNYQDLISSIKQLLPNLAHWHIALQRASPPRVFGPSMIEVDWPASSSMWLAQRGGGTRSGDKGKT